MPIGDDLGLRVNVTPSYLIVYRTVNDINRYNVQQERRTPKGELSTVSVRKIRQAINTLELVAKYKRSYNPKFKSWYQWKLSFITLTLPAPQRISDKEFRRHYLGHFIVEFCRKYLPTGYVYRLEPQKNGNIHVHLITDVYIDARVIRNLWNRILSKGHFIDEFERDNGHRDPNSTDVHSLSNVKNAVAYLSAYISKKSDDRRKIEGKLWGCSQNLLARLTLPLTSEMDEELTKFVQSGQYKFYRPEDCPYICFYFFDSFEVPNLFFERYRDQFYDWIDRVNKGPNIGHLEKFGV